MSDKVTNCMWAKIVQEEPGDMTHYSFMVVLVPDFELYVYPHFMGASLKGYMHDSLPAFFDMWKKLESVEDVRAQADIVAAEDYWMQSSTSDEEENPFTVASAIRCTEKAFDSWIEENKCKKESDNVIERKS